ncbi:hypothetical protein RB195_004909 [Necator americanus]|uniref:Uncharacterized protein n=1 Tax=Necator americanus TaxID=51031 RepID=A0ABR1BP85_NECAM
MMDKYESSENKISARRFQTNNFPCAKPVKNHFGLIKRPNPQDRPQRTTIKKPGYRRQYPSIVGAKHESVASDGLKSVICAEDDAAIASFATYHCF